jgi:hypothetical protein
MPLITWNPDHRVTKMLCINCIIIIFACSAKKASNHIRNCKSSMVYMQVGRHSDSGIELNSNLGNKLFTSNKMINNVFSQHHIKKAHGGIRCCKSCTRCYPKLWLNVGVELHIPTTVSRRKILWYSLDMNLSLL